MILKHFGQLKTLAKKTFGKIKAKVTAVFCGFVPESISVVRGAKKILVAAADGNVLDMGKRYRLTSGHAPLFSLFTFFKNSQ